MTKQFLSVSLAALLVAGGGFAAVQAQQGQGGSPMGQQRGPGTMMQQGGEADEDDAMGMRGMERMQRMMQQMMSRMGDDRGMRGRTGRDSGMRGRGYRHGMMHHRGMGRSGMHRAHMMRTLIILMDTDGDGELSLEEVQAVTERFFNAMDADNSGTLSLEEIRAFYAMRGAMPGMPDNGEDEVELDDDDNGGTDGPGQAQ